MRWEIFVSVLFSDNSTVKGDNFRVSTMNGGRNGDETHIKNKLKIFQCSVDAGQA